MASSADAVDDDRIPRIASAIRVIRDFPKPGILFYDITTLLLDPEAFKDTIDLFVERYKHKKINVVAGEVISEEYSLSYGTDKIEMHVGAVQAGERALVVDDLIASGGTLSAAIRLLGSCYLHMKFNHSHFMHKGVLEFMWLNAHVLLNCLNSRVGTN